MCRYFYPNSPSPYRFVNTGSWMGYVRSVRHLLKSIVGDKDPEEVGSSVAYSFFSMVFRILCASPFPQVGKMNDQELITNYFICDVMNGYLKQDPSGKLLEEVSLLLSLPCFAFCFRLCLTPCGSF
jgi:hypothetical protein